MPQYHQFTQRRSRTSLERNDERQFLLEFINVYKSLPALWDSRCKEYVDRELKAEQYEILLDKYRERYPDANKKQLTTKINVLRTNFRKEYNRLRDLIKKKPNGLTKFETNLWYYNELYFIAEVSDYKANMSTTSDITDIMDYDDESNYFSPRNMQQEQEQLQHEPQQIPQIQNIKTCHSGVSQMEKYADQLRYEQTQSTSNSCRAPTPLKRIKKSRSDDENSYVVVEEQHATPATSAPAETVMNCKHRYVGNQQKQNEFQKIGETWAFKLQKMDAQQQIFAEKFINDILFEGLLGTLHRDAMQLSINTTSMQYTDAQENPLIIEYEPNKIGKS